MEIDILITILTTQYKKMCDEQKVGQPNYKTGWSIIE